MPLSNYCGNALLNSLFGKTSDFGALPSAPTLYVGLLTAEPSASDTGSTVTECAYTGYAREATAATDWDAAASKEVDNGALVEFGECTAGSETVTYAALFDAATGGNLLAWGAVGTSLAVSAGVKPEFPIGDLAMTMT